MYHSLEKENKDYPTVTRKVFYQQMKFIKDNGYKVISLEEYCYRIKEKKKIPRNTVVITFDDGYKDNLEAVKILKEFNFPATIFVIVDKIGKDPYLDEDNIRFILENSSVKIGSHTLSHAYLPELDNKNLKKEIRESKKKLESLFSYKVKVISYPAGGFDKRVLKEVKKAGYLCACTTNRGFSSKPGLFSLRRIKITNRDLGIRLWAKLSGFYNSFRKVKSPY
jgi:peptidoglycan/xylan/chitin deacetylase (PgdA/CDA1 family)